MNPRFLGVAGLIAAMTIAIPTAAARTAPAASSGGNTLTVWLQVDARDSWPDLVASTNREFERRNPGWSVDVQYQRWPDHLASFDATLAGGNVPDVKEMGNTEMTKYMAAGAFTNLTADRRTFANSRNWLSGLAASATYNRRLFGVPYYAGSRVVTYRRDLFQRVNARVPRTLAEFTNVIRRLRARNGSRSFSPVYMAGTDWYIAMGFVYDYGGRIANFRGGRWEGALHSPRARAGLAAFKRFFQAGSRASATSIETRPNPYDVYAQGNAASIVGPAWFTCCVGDAFKPMTSQFVMPGHRRGQSMPGFLGGSDLAIPARSDAKTQAKAWIRLFTNTQSQRVLQQKGNIPNATNLLGNSVNERAARRSWFVPTARNWVDVENANVLRTMLTRILRGQSIQSAARAASDSITRTLNRR